jgi:hypothetical protein
MYSRDTGCEYEFPRLYLWRFFILPQQYTGKGKTNPVQAHYRPRGFQEFEAPRFVEIRHLNVVRLSAALIGRLYPPGNIPGTHFC